MGHDSFPRARRPYGALKLNEEQYLSLWEADVVKVVDRPSSIYGVAGSHHRMGLLPTLIWNGFHQRVSRIFGQADTLRDYVLANDIGKFVAACVSRGCSNPRTFFLATGRPSSLYEVVRKVEMLLGKRIYVSYLSEKHNAEHNTFSRVALPNEWAPTDLETGTRMIFR